MTAFRIRHEVRGGHVYVQVFVADNDWGASYALAGVLVFRKDEHNDVLALFSDCGQVVAYDPPWNPSEIG